MRFSTLPIEGARLIELERFTDERGFFARAWCVEEFAAQGIPAMVQANISFNRQAGTLRGMHFAHFPAQEGKLVRCSQGCIHDVLLDMRPDSPSYLRHHAVSLSAEARNAVFIPPGVAHGFQSLQDDCEVTYLMTEAYDPQWADGVRHDDPCFGIDWPLPVSLIAARDKSYPDFDDARHRQRCAKGAIAQQVPPRVSP